MDLSTIIGIVGGFGLIIWGIMLSGNISNFIDPPSIVIVLGGSIMAIIASYPFSVLKDVPRHFAMLIQNKKYNCYNAIEELVEMATEARKNGLLALEQRADGIKDVFFKNALMLIVDAYEPAEVKERLNNELDLTYSRHEDAIGIYEKAANVAPAFGMIGTLIGLINMLRSLDLSSGASDSLGQNMSVAMVTTFYGCVFAHLIFSSIAKKLSIRNADEILYKQIIIEGVLSIQKGDNPKFLQEKLLCFLSERKRGGGKKGKGAAKESAE